MEKAGKVFVSVLGANGIVYQRKIFSYTAKSIYIDITSLDEANCEIYLFVKEWRVLQGELGWFCKQ